RLSFPVSLACGGTTSENCTYLVQASTSTPTADPCTFTICKCSSNICRIRLDFTTFLIAGPTVGTASTDTLTNGASIGDCMADTFSVTSPGNQGSPLICGFNTGQHMILDSSDKCNKASFDFSGTATSRQFDIKVTQFACGDEMGGKARWLLAIFYWDNRIIREVSNFEGRGKICLKESMSSNLALFDFNFPTTGTTVTSTVTHLSSQCYTMCFRQEEGKCAICFDTVIPGAATAAVIDQGSFGLSISSDGDPKGTQDTGCSTDYLQVNKTSAQTPFRVLFKTDSDEDLTATTDSSTSEQVDGPGGIIGFYLNYALQDCQ
ncbi:hypothetical protein TCAL_13257, partial [Tigriopus californicus]